MKTSLPESDLGMIGLGVMRRKLASNLSAFKEERAQAGSRLDGPERRRTGEEPAVLAQLRNAYETVVLVTYARGRFHSHWEQE